MPDLIATNPTATAIVAGICLWISLCLIVRLWATRRTDPALRKLVWSAVLLLPLFGWLFYGAFYRPPARQEGALPEHGQGAW